MSHCERFESLISGCLDGELRPTDRLELLDHFVRCSSCREFYLEARSLDGLVAAVRSPAGEEPPAPEVWEGIEVAASSEPKVQTRAKAIPAWALRAAAVMVLGVGLALLVWKPIGPSGSARGADTVPTAQIEVLLEEEDGMTEERFVQLTTEVLKADRRYHAAMLEVMEQVIRDTEGGEGVGREGTSDREGVDSEDETRNSERDLA